MGSKKLTAFLLVLVVVFSNILMSAEAATGERNVRVGCFPLNGFFEISKDGQVSGYGAEYTNAIAEHARWNCSYVPYTSWVEALRALSKHEIDILAPSQRTSAREALYDFDSFPIATEYGALLTLTSNKNLQFEDFTAFNGLKVGCVSSLVFLPVYKEYQARNKFATEMLYYNDTPALLSALQAGEVDAIVANMMVKTDSMRLLARFGASPVYYMMNKNATGIQEEMNQAIDRLTSNHPEFQKQLDNTYFSSFIAMPLSKAEIDFVKTCEPLNVASPTEDAPYSYVDATGQVTGVDRAILERVGQITGLRFKYVPIAKGNKAESFIDKQNISLLRSREYSTYTELHNGSFTESYVAVAKCFVGKNRTSFDTQATMKVALVEATLGEIADYKKAYPQFVFTNYKDLTQCIEAVHKGEQNLILGNRYALENALSIPQNADLEILPLKIINEPIRFKVTRGGNVEQEKILISILNKGLKQISFNDREKYVSDFVQATRYKFTFKDFLYQYRFQVILLLLFMMAIVMAVSIIMKARHKASLIVEESEKKLRQITNNINGGVIVLLGNNTLVITYANDGFLELIGCSRKEFEASAGSYLTYVHHNDLPVLHEALAKGEKEISLELRILKNDGLYVPVLFNCTIEEKPTGEKVLYCVVLDMTEQNSLLEQLRIDKQRTELILERVEEIFYEVDFRDKSIRVSPSFGKKLGWVLPNKFTLGKVDDFATMWHTDSENLLKLHSSTRAMLDTKKTQNVAVQLQVLPKGESIWCEISQFPILGKDGTIISVIGLIKDINAQIEERNRLLEISLRDQLTGLYNKKAFEQIVGKHLAAMPNQNHALIFVDLDHFKAVNDNLGHLIGDRAISEAADKLKIIFSNYDILARFGGDEFCIFVKNIPLDTLRGKMDWLVEKMRSDYSNGKDRVRVTCSCGIACTDDVGFDYTVLMDSADKALYTAKENGRDQVVFFRNILQK